MTKSMSNNSITTLYRTQDTEILNSNILPTIVTEDTTQHEPFPVKCEHFFITTWKTTLTLFPKKFCQASHFLMLCSKEKALSGLCCESRRLVQVRLFQRSQRKVTVVCGADIMQCYYYFQ